MQDEMSGLLQSFEDGHGLDDLDVNLNLAPAHAAATAAGASVLQDVDSSSCENPASRLLAGADRSNEEDVDAVVFLVASEDAVSLAAAEPPPRRTSCFDLGSRFKIVVPRTYRNGRGSFVGTSLASVPYLEAHVS